MALYGLYRLGRRMFYTGSRNNIKRKHFKVRRAQLLERTLGGMHGWVIEYLPTQRTTGEDYTSKAEAEVAADRLFFVMVVQSALEQTHGG